MSIEEKDDAIAPAYVQELRPKTENEVMMESVKDIFSGLAEMRRQENETDAITEREKNRLTHEENRLTHEERMIDMLHQYRSRLFVTLCIVSMGAIGAAASFFFGKPDIAATIIVGSITGILGLHASVPNGKRRKDN